MPIDVPHRRTAQVAAHPRTDHAMSQRVNANSRLTGCRLEQAIEQRHHRAPTMNAVVISRVTKHERIAGRTLRDALSDPAKEQMNGGFVMNRKSTLCGRRFETTRHRAARDLNLQAPPVLVLTLANIRDSQSQ